MKRLQSIGIKNFKNGMYSSDASELVGQAILLENVIHDEELGKTVKMKDYLLTQLNNWATDYYVPDGTIYTVEDMIFFSPEENLEYLVVALKLGPSFAIYSFIVETSGALTYKPELSFPINEVITRVRLSVAGKVLRICYTTSSGYKAVKWYGEIKNKEMFFVDGFPQETYNGFYLDEAKPQNTAITLGTYSVPVTEFDSEGNLTDIETDSEGYTPTEENYSSGIEYFKNYKVSVQVDDSQESEFADLMVSTAPTAKAPSFDINVNPGFSKRLSKIHIWRRISKDPVSYNDSHELIKTLDVARQEYATSIIEDNQIPINNVMLAIDYPPQLETLLGYALIKQRVLASDIPSNLLEHSTTLNMVFILVSFGGVDYYWGTSYVGEEYIEFVYNGSWGLNTAVTSIPLGALISAGTYDVYPNLGFTVPTGAVCELTIDDVSFKNVFTQTAHALIPSAHIDSTLRPIDNSISIPESTIVSNGTNHIVTDTVLCSFGGNSNQGFSIIGSSELIAQFELKSGGGYVYNFTDNKPFEFGTGQFYSEEHGIIRGDFPLYTQAIKYNNRLFVIDGPDIRWSEVFKYDMFKPESIHTGKNDFNFLVVFRDVLFAFSENDVVVLNYAGTEVNWRTSDTLDDIGTKYIWSIQVTPVGVFFTDGKGIYVLASTMQMGKQSYTEYQRIDDPIKDLIDFDEVDVNDLVGHYDIKNSRYVLSNADDGNQYVFSVNGKGWFIRASTDYPSVVRSLGRYGIINKSNDETYFTQFIDGVINDDQCLIYTGWFFVGDPHNTTWWRELFILLKNAKQNWYDSTTYTASIKIEYDDGTVEDLGTIDESYYTGDNAIFEETRLKINEKIKRYRLRINSNYPIFEYDHLEITYTPTGTY